MASTEQLIFEILAKDAQASAAFDRFRRKVDDTSKSVDKNSTSLDKNTQSAKKNEQANRSLLGALGGTALAFAPITAGAAAAGIGVGAFAALAVPSVMKVTKALTGPGGLSASWDQLDNRQRVAAQGVQQLEKRYQGLAKQLEPQVFQNFNQGLGLANSLLGPTGRLAQAGGQGLSDFLAQFQNDSGIQHFITFLSTQARPALDLLGSDVTHLTHTIFSLLEAFGPTGISELRLLTGAFTALDDSVSFLSTHAPGLSSAALSIGGIALAMHKLGVLQPALRITGLASIPGQLKGFTAATKGATLAEKGLLASSTALEAITPWGWAAAGAAVLGGLAFAVTRLGNGTEATVAQIEKQNKAIGFNTSGYFSAAKSLHLLTLQQEQQNAVLNKGVQGSKIAAGANAALQIKTDALTAAEKRLISGAQEQDKFLGLLEGKYSLTRQQAVSLAGASGILVDKTGHLKGTFADAVTKASAFADSMSKAGGPAGVLGTDLFVMSQDADRAASKVNAVNTAWDTFLGMSSDLQTAELGVIGQLRQLAKDAKAAGASFTGVNDKSIALQNEFAAMVTSTGGVIDKMRLAHASTQDLATVLATDLRPAVDHGALANKAFRAQIFAMAEEAGYAGPNRVKPLQAWIDRYAGSVAHAKGVTDGLAGSMARIPRRKDIAIHVTGSGSWAVVGGGHRVVQGGQPPGTSGAAALGMYINSGRRGVDDQLIMAQRGELVVPAPMVSSGAVDHLRGMIPGFESGGVVGRYQDGVPGLSKWLRSEDQATINAIAGSVESAFKAAMPPPGSIGPFPGGGSTGPGPAAAQAYALGLLPAYGWGIEQMLPLIALWNRESGWRWNALNPTSGAYGIPQSLPASKMAAAGPDWLTNPATQIRWGEGYIKSVYGSPAGAWAHEEAVGWYGNGLDAVISRPTLIGVGERGSERVQVTPVRQGGGGDMSRVEQLLGQLIDAVYDSAAQNAADTADGVAGALGAAGRKLRGLNRYSPA